MSTAEVFLRSAPVHTLVQAARGEIDLNEMAHYELAKRGMNKLGGAVGVQAAMKEWGEAYGATNAEPRCNVFPGCGCPTDCRIPF